MINIKIQGISLHIKEFRLAKIKRKWHVYFIEGKGNRETLDGR